MRSGLPLLSSCAPYSADRMDANEAAGPTKGRVALREREAHLGGRELLDLVDQLLPAVLGHDQGETMGGALPKGAVAVEQAAEGEEHVVGIELTRGLEIFGGLECNTFAQVEVYCSPSGLTVQRSASAGISSSVPQLGSTSWLKIWSVARWSTPLSELAGQKVLGLPVEQKRSRLAPWAQADGASKVANRALARDGGQQASWGFDLGRGAKAGWPWRRRARQAQRPRCPG